MSSKKHTDTIVDLNRSYEENDVKLKGIIWFGGGLFLLIVITFALMWFFLGLLEDYSKETAGPPNPMLQNERDRLPPEPRLQGAPGFGVESPKGWVNMELKEPQAEWWELEKQWDELKAKGQKDEKTGAVISLPIEDAKAKFLEQGVKAKSGPEAEEFLRTSQTTVSDASAGRLSPDTRR